jgi:hypothetical protein
MNGRHERSLHPLGVHISIEEEELTVRYDCETRAISFLSALRILVIVDGHDISE